jgi:Cu/Ag efflux protein CusF
MKYLATLIAASGLMFAQHAANAKSHPFKGKVIEVSKDKLTVEHGNIEGFMAAMTMGYKVDKSDVLANVKAGDQIEATVYDDDFTLYNVKVVAAAKGKAK